RRDRGCGPSADLSGDRGRARARRGTAAGRPRAAPGLRGGDRTRRRRSGRASGADPLVNELLVLGLSHKTAPVAVRERLSVTDAQVERLLQKLRDSPDVHEAAVLSTCNRTEVYLVAGDPVR